MRVGYIAPQDIVDNTARLANFGGYFGAQMICTFKAEATC